MNFAEIIVPLPLNAVFTYSIPHEMKGKVSVGARVVVPFGRRKFYTGIVESLTPLKPEGFDVKPIARLLDEPGKPVMVNPQLKFWRWIADYYMCSIGDVMRAALPSALKLESETFVEARENPDDEELHGLSDEEALMYATLQHHGKLTLGDLVKHSGLSANPERLLAGLMARGLASISEKVVERYRSLKQTLVSLPPEAATAGWRTSAFAITSRSPKQERLLLQLLQINASGTLEVEKNALLEAAGVSAAILKSLEQRNLVHVRTVVVNRFAASDAAPAAPLPELSPAQTTARNSILSLWAEQGQNTVLLRGVTGSGKTEIYIHLIDRALRSGLQTLFLVPEIALTTQLTSRLQRVFGSKVIVYHSKFTDNERVDIWQRLLHSHEPLVVIGARSSVFLPFDKLGLVIIDEEHEPSYKQFDPAPRYNARDSALVLASLHGAKVLLGSASPSVETYYKAQSGRYGLVELTERYGGIRLPDIEVTDMNAEFKKHRFNGPIAAPVRSAVEASLAAGKQAIIFHNRRGFAPMARCKACAHIPKCMNCDVSLTYHRSENRLVCHYCGATYPLPGLCPQCHEPAIEIVGYGTERIEEEVDAAFPDAKILRMDLDTTRNKDGYQEIINNFSAHKADILVGTQMVTKGLDFGDVNTVAVLSADLLINLPDFRSAERAFNMLLQVAGRAGRRDTPGRVMVQTAQPSHPVIEHLRTHNYEGFYREELEQRRAHSYPPFSRMIFIYLKHADEATVQQMAELYGAQLRQRLGNRISGPDKPPVGRVQSLHIRRFMLKVELNASMAKVKQILRDDFDLLLAAHPNLRAVKISYDVDPT